MNSRKGNVLVLVLGGLALIFALGMGYLYFQNQQLTTQSIIPVQHPSILPTTTPHAVITRPLSTRVGLTFQTVWKSFNTSVLGDSTINKKTIPVQIFNYEDTNGNGVKEPGENGLFLLPIGIYDSPFSDTPIQTINSTDTGWASIQVSVGPPYQLILKPMATADYYPTTPAIIVSEQNNFAVFGYQKRKDRLFSISVFSFIDANKDGNYEYDDKSEKPLFLAPFTFYQQTSDGAWSQLPNSVNSTDTGWATVEQTVKFPYKVKIQAGDVNGYTPSNKEIIITNSNSTLVFPYIAQ